MTIYVALVPGEHGSYGVSLPDLPGCTSGGETIDTALAHLQLAASDWVDFEDVVLAAAIEVDLPGGIERLSITMADALLAQIDKAAEKTGESRSGWLAAAARLRLRLDAGGVPFGQLRAKAPTKASKSKSKSKGGASGKRAAALHDRRRNGAHERHLA